MILYALYHPSTGNYMPALMFKHNTNGQTWWEPLGIPGLGGYTDIPRLFKTAHAANMAKHAWAKGPRKKNKVIEFDGWDSPSYEVIMGSTSTDEQLMSRSIDDLKIITVKLEEITK